jgi:2-polyprenyl-3-methyl-5-hydroxy-6-metoxy-1,4-benzoquinol methylase
MSTPVFSNLMNNPVVDTNKQYDAVGCFYCLEEVASNPDGLRQVVSNAASMLKPGGALLVASLWNSNFYHLKDESGQTQVIESFPVTEELLKDAVHAAGLQIPEGGLQLIKTTAQADEGVSGTLCVYATRP